MPTVLCVDDDRTTLDLLFHLLKSQGFHAETAASVEEAVALAETITPDALLLDLLLPGHAEDIWWGVRHIAEQPSCAGKPVIIMSAVPNCFWGKVAQEQGFSAFLEKPFRPRQLFDLLHQVLHSASPAD